MLKHAAQLYGIIFSKLLHFSVILQFIKELCLYTRVYQLSIYELVFSKWPTIVKMSRGFLVRSARNNDFFLNKKNPCGK